MACARACARILAAILVTVLLRDAAAAWAVNDRLAVGARHEAEGQARVQAAQVRALFAERATTLAAEGEAVSLYSAVIAANAGGNNQPLLQWSGDGAAPQGARVTVGDNLAAKLAGLRLALAGQKVSGAELGLALRGYAPTCWTPVAGAVMIAVPAADQVHSSARNDRSAKGD